MQKNQNVNARNDHYDKMWNAFESCISNFQKSCPSMSECLLVNNFDNHPRYNPKLASGMSAELIFLNYAFHLKYNNRATLSDAQGKLSIYFQFKKSDPKTYYTFYDLYNLIAPDDFGYFPCNFVINPELLIKSIEYILSKFIQYQKHIEILAFDSDLIKQLEKNRQEDVQSKYGKFASLYDEESSQSASKDSNLISLKEQAIIPQTDIIGDVYFNSNIIRLMIQKKMNKAQKALAHPKANIYSKRLAQKIKAHDTTLNFEKIMPDWYRNMISAGIRLKTSPKEGIIFILIAFLISPVWMIVYSLLFYMLLAIKNTQVEYLIGPTIFFEFLLSFISGIATSYFIRHRIMRRFFNKHRKERLELDYVTNGKASDKLISRLTKVVVAACVIFTFLNVNCNISVLKNGLNINRSILRVKSDFVAYQQIHRLEVIKVDGELYNLILYYGENLKFDFFDEMFYSDSFLYWKKFISVLEKKGVVIKEVSKAKQ